MKRCVCTLLTTDAYLPGAIVLAKSLDESGSVLPKVALVTQNLSGKTIKCLSKYYHVISIPTLVSKDTENLELLGRPDLASTLSKISVWKLPFDQVVFLDADTMVLQNIDTIFDHLQGSFAAAPDIGWPDCFNSGVFVCRPNPVVYDELKALLQEKGSFDGGDQGLLNEYFSDWITKGRLPFTFNVTPSAFYSYLPAFVKFRKDVRIVHFIGRLKPWMWSRFTDGRVIATSNTSEYVVSLIQKWWGLFDKYNVHKDLVGIENMSRNWAHYSSPQNNTFPVKEFVQYKAEWNEEEVKKIIRPISPVKDLRLKPVPALFKPMSGGWDERELRALKLQHSDIEGELSAGTEDEDDL